MKVILRILFLLILLLIAIPCAVVGAVLINDASVPVYLQNFNYEEFNPEEEMNEKLQYVMMSNVLGNKKIEVNEEFVAKFLSSSTKGFKDAKIKLADGFNAGIEYVWFTFDDDILSMYGTVAFNETRTTFTAKLSFKDYAGYTEVTVHTLKIGKLPISKSLIIYGINQLEEEGLDLNNINPYGGFELEELTFTIEDEYINNMFKQALKTDLISFTSIKFDDQDITLNYEFSTTPEAVAIDTALTEFKNLVTSEEKRTSINNQLEQLKTNGTIDEATQTSINSVLDMLQSKTDPNVEFTFTDDDIKTIEELTTNFSNLNSDQANQISQVFIDNMDQAAIDEIKKQLESSSGNKDLTQILNEFLGKK